PFFAVAVAVPIVLVIYYAYKMNLEKIKQAQQHVQELDELYHSTIASLAMAIDAKDQSTHGHVQRVQALTLGLARFAGITDENELKGLRAASLLHDIGKLAVPEYILNKPSQLTEAETAKIRAHPSVGADILETIPFPYKVAPYVRYHHERWDGTGYPQGLKGEEIPLGARILAVVDCYDALRSDRPYRPELSRELTLDYIQQEAGRAYDPKIVEILVNNIAELEAEIERAEKETPQRSLVQLEDTLDSAARDSRKLNKTVFHDIASTHKEIQAVYEISQSIGKSLNVSETLSLLASKIKKFVPYSACSIYLVSSEDDRMLPHHVSGMYKDILDTVEVRLGEGITGWVAANNEPLVDVSAAPEFPGLKVLRSVFRSCLAVPLSMDDSVVGVITLYSTHTNVYQYDHLRLMEMIAPHAAAAINNAIIHEEIQEDAYTDALTGLPNLRYFNAFIEEELRRARRISYPVTVLMMDLERFKEVNDIYGHKTGDNILVQVAQILKNQMRRSDTCLRYGGDEFVGVLPGVNKELAQQTIKRIQTYFDNHSIPLNDEKTIRLGVSIGAATFPEDGVDPESLLSVADHAMYRDKLYRATRARGPGAVLPFEKRADNV
ncbi:MAG TPA: diguanylate cyclase, partial [Acidobacteriota bacterium]|nr:diguanylate cyclase [Acidobacteriota bacterium]